MEHTGTPIDVEMLAKIQARQNAIKDRLTAEVDKDFGVYENGSFRQHLFEHYLGRRGIAWPRTATGKLETKDRTFQKMAKVYPELYPLRELKHFREELDLGVLSVGPDGRNRASLFPFQAKTGRNQPSTTRYIFGLPAWARGLIRPEPGTALAYIDYSQQEFGIAAALSGDEAMMRAYNEGDRDFYLAFAKIRRRTPLCGWPRSRWRRRTRQHGARHWLPGRRSIRPRRASGMEAALLAGSSRRRGGCPSQVLSG
jgi:hypothetical protein